MKIDIVHTKKSYDTYGKEYHRDRTDSRMNFYNRFLEKPTMKKLLKNIVDGKRVLDLGCGSGVFTKDLINWGGKVKGIDLSKTLIEIAKKENPKAKFYIGNAVKTPFDDSEFDIVASNLVVHYFKDVKPLFKEVARVLKKGGIFVFYTHHPLIGNKRKVIIDGKDEMVLLPYFENRRFTWEMLKGMEVISYQHNFENLVSGMHDTGFIVEELLEPKPPKHSKKLDKKIYDKTIKYPSACAIKARKV
jgi:SAM-dependent methyltransferase